MKREVNPPTKPSTTPAKKLFTALYITLVGGVGGIVISVVARAWQEIQQQLGSGAAPGLLALVVKLLYTSLILLSGAADAVVRGATVGLGVGLAAALLYLAYGWWARRHHWPNLHN